MCGSQMLGDLEVVYALCVEKSKLLHIYHPYKTFCEVTGNACYIDGEFHRVKSICSLWPGGLTPRNWGPVFV